MGKGGSPTTTQTVQNQNVGYTPTGLQGFQDIYNRAVGVANQPYQAYGGQLVQGLTPTQLSAIGRISGIAGQPIGAQQIQQYMNPFQDAVINATMGNIAETNRQQMAQTTGQLTGAAGGIGADRIALGQGELARQQGLASNQTLAGLQQQNYMQALAAAQQQQGFGLGAAQAQLGAGGLEQQTGQAGLTAQYQQYLQQLAFPYQQMQFLAGIGLPSLGAMGGQQYQTGTANQTFTPPGMSWLQGLAGLGSLGWGAYQGYNQPKQASGGRIHGYADGGGTDDDKDEGYPSYDSFDLGKEDYKDVTPTQDQAAAEVEKPTSYVPSGKVAAFNQPVPQFAPMQQTQQQGGGKGSTSSGLGDLGKLIGTAASVIPFFLKEGGRTPHYADGGDAPMGAAPTPAMLGSPLTRGALPVQAQMNSPNVFYGKPLPNMLPAHPVHNPQQANESAYEMARQALNEQQLGMAMAQLRSRMTNEPQVSVTSTEYADGGFAGGSPNADPMGRAGPGGMAPPMGMPGGGATSGIAAQSGGMAGGMNPQLSTPVGMPNGITQPGMPSGMAAPMGRAGIGGLAGGTPAGVPPSIGAPQGFAGGASPGMAAPIGRPGLGVAGGMSPQPGLPMPNARIGTQPGLAGGFSDMSAQPGNVGGYNPGYNTGYNSGYGPPPWWSGGGMGKGSNQFRGYADGGSVDPGMGRSGGPAGWFPPPGAFPGGSAGGMPAPASAPPPAVAGGTNQFAGFTPPRFGQGAPNARIGGLGKGSNPFSNVMGMMMSPLQMLGQRTGMSAFNYPMQALSGALPGYGSMLSYAGIPSNPFGGQPTGMARGGKADYPEHDERFYSNQQWDADRRAIDRGPGVEQGYPIIPGTKTHDPEGLHRDVRHLQDGGPSDDSYDIPMPPQTRIDEDFPAPVWHKDAAQAAEDALALRRQGLDWTRRGLITPSARPGEPVGSLPTPSAGPPATTGDIAWHGPASEAQKQAALAKLAQPRVSASAEEPQAAPGGGGASTMAGVLPTIPQQLQLQRQPIRSMMKDPDFWIRTGLNILAQNPAKGAIGAIASGAMGEIGDYDKFSKDSLSAQQKGIELMERLKQHADKYTRMTPAEQERIRIEDERLRETKRFHESLDPMRASQIINRYRQTHPASLSMSDEEVAAAALAEARSASGQQGAVAPAATTKTLPPGVQAEPDPGKGNRKNGRWYIGPSGQPQQWLGPDNG